MLRQAFLLFFFVSFNQGFSLYPTCLQTVCPDGCRCIDTSTACIPNPRCVPKDCPIPLCYDTCNSTTLTTAAPQKK